MSHDVESLDENTNDFLAHVGYPNVHMMWSEWLDKATAYELNDREIAELEQYLEENKQLTVPIRFAGRQWWLTKQEIQHIEIIKKYYPNNWEVEVQNRMQTGDLGYIKKEKRPKQMR